MAYFDGPGGTQVPRVVADAMSDYLLHHNANTHWVYPTSVETDALLMQARETLAEVSQQRRGKLPSLDSTAACHIVASWFAEPNWVRV